MPKPVYIICSESGTQDKNTGLVSLFNIVEKFQISEISPEQKQKGLGGNAPVVRMIAVWMRSQEDENQGFEYEVVLFVPPNDREVGGGPGGRFQFTHPLHRLTMTLVLPSGFEGAGVMRVENRVRKVGDQHWLRQEYPIFIEKVPSDKEQSA